MISVNHGNELQMLLVNHNLDFCFEISFFVFIIINVSSVVTFGLFSS